MTELWWGNKDQAGMISGLLRDNPRIFVNRECAEDNDHTGTRVLAVELPGSR